MNWLEMLKGPPGRLSTVRRLSDEEIATRETDLEAHGDVICAGCGKQDFATGYIYHGVFILNETTKKYDVASMSGACVYECPNCHLIGDEPTNHDAPYVPHGIMFIAGWMILKGEWREQICNNDSCTGKGKPYIGLGCPGCGDLMFWHHDSRTDGKTHGWEVRIDNGNILTMSPSLLELQGTRCHFCINSNQVQWC